MRTLAIVIALIAIGSTIQQKAGVYPKVWGKAPEKKAVEPTLEALGAEGMNLNLACIMKIVEVIPIVKAIDITKVMKDASYRLELLSYATTIYEVCIPKTLKDTMTLKPMSFLLGQQAPSCTETLGKMVSVMKLVSADMMARKFNNMISHYNSFVTLLAAAKQVCL